MNKFTEYRDFLKSVRSSLGYWKSYSLLQFTASLTRMMRLEKVSGKKLAQRMGVSATQVSKVLRGQENVTIETMAKFAGALDATVHIHVAKRGVRVQWQEIPEGRVAHALDSIGPAIRGQASSMGSVTPPVPNHLPLPIVSAGTLLPAENFHG